MKDTTLKLSSKNDNLKPYINESKLSNEIMTNIRKYDGIMSLVSVIGILELIKIELIENNKNKG